jgi:hypothetical protein
MLNHKNYTNYLYEKEAKGDCFLAKKFYLGNIRKHQNEFKHFGVKKALNQ